MLKRKKIVIGFSAAVVVVALWALFRPELLFIDAHVDEKLPDATRTGAVRILAQGDFRGLAHETKGTATIHEIVDGSAFIQRNIRSS